MEINVIETGYFYADGGAMFGAIPKTAWSRRYASDGQNGCVLAMRSLLIKANDRLVIVDTGSGEKHLKKLAYYRFFKMRNIAEIMQNMGYAPEDVTDVVLTHLHFDHCAGCTYRDTASGDLKLTFPGAVHWVSRKQWANFCNPHPLERASFFAEDMLPVEFSGNLHLLDAPTSICPGISLHFADGHTPGQIVPYIHNGNETVVFAGDVIPLFANISAGWISAYDISPTDSYNAKMLLLEEAAAERQRIVFCHDAYTVSSCVKKTSGGLFVPDK